MDMRNRQQSRRNKSTDTEEEDPRCLLCSYYDDFIACFSCPLRRLYCLFLISITATIAWFSSPLDLTIWTKSAFLGVKGGSNEFFTYLTVFRGVISFTYQNFLLGNRVPLRKTLSTTLKTTSRTTSINPLFSTSRATRQPDHQTTIPGNVWKQIF